MWMQESIARCGACLGPGSGEEMDELIQCFSQFYAELSENLLSWLRSVLKCPPFWTTLMVLGQAAALNMGHALLISH